MNENCYICKFPANMVCEKCGESICAKHLNVVRYNHHFPKKNYCPKCAEEFTQRNMMIGLPLFIIGILILILGFAY